MLIAACSGALQGQQQLHGYPEPLQQPPQQYGAPNQAPYAQPGDPNNAYQQPQPQAAPIEDAQQQGNQLPSLH